MQKVNLKLNPNLNPNRSPDPNAVSGKLHMVNAMLTERLQQQPLLFTKHHLHFFVKVAP